MNNILVLDAYNLIYRARYSGMNKGDHSTIFNFFRGIRPLVEKFKPDITYFVLEGMPKKRLEVDSNYKGQRVYTNDDNFSEQRREIIKLVKSNMPFITVRHPDYECDDIINYLACVKHEQDNVTIISSDTDFIQSIGDSVNLYNPVRKSFIQKPKYDYVSWKSLVGDKSDNIIGFKGIGDKRAQKLLEDTEKFNIFLNESNHKEKFDTNKFMIKFHDLSNEDIENIEVTNNNNFDWNTLKEIFINYDFKSLTQKDNTWQKYVNTFNNLERNIINV